MTRDKAHFFALFLFCACSQDVHTQPSDTTSNVTQSTTSGSCSALNDACPGIRVLQCTDAQASCVGQLADNYTDFCTIAMGDEQPCVNGQVTDTFKHYCAIDNCFGGTMDACLKAGANACNGGGGSCGPIDAYEKNCPTWNNSYARYVCQTRYTADEQACIADVLTFLHDNGQECFDWSRPYGICTVGHVSVIGFGLCMIEECLGLTNAEECAANYDVQCQMIWAQLLQ